MGQCYSVTAEVIFTNGDSSPFCKAIRKKIESMDGKTARFRLDGLNLGDPFDCFRAVTSIEDAHTLSDSVWYADFNASYGWESVMYEIFEDAVGALDNGSYVQIYPDSGSTLIEKTATGVRVTCRGD